MNNHSYLTKKTMTWNTNYNNDEFTSSPILKRHKKNPMMDDGEKTTTTSSTSTSSTTTTTICDLPGELLTQVLMRLSLKDILACVCVQKSWYSLIKTYMFITLYSNYHKTISNPNDDIKYLLFWNTRTNGYEIRVDDIQCEKYLTFKFPTEPPRFGMFSCRLVSNGLICIFQSTENTDDGIYLWNPVIQRYKTLPKSPHPPYICKKTQWKAIAFGFVPEINDYVVVFLVKYGLTDKPHTHYVMTCVYSLNTNSWRKISCNNNDDVSGVCRVSPHDSCFVNGVAVWGALDSRRKRIIMCFDTKTDVLRVIPLPQCVDKSRSLPSIYPFGESIVYFFKKKKDDTCKLGMWILKGDVMNEFVWKKKRIARFRNNALVDVLGLRNNGDPILCHSHCLSSYSLDSRKHYDFVNSWDRQTCVSPFVVKPFVQSLRWLNID